MLVKRNKKKIILLALLTLCINIIITLIPDLGEDEAFTIGLVKHSYSEIININELDVHPPLYYLILKLFLTITTFWTNSIVMKIVFSRIFSLISFFVLFYFLIKTFKVIKIHFNYLLLLICYLLFPSISFFSTYIRMYQLSAMFIAMEVYGLAIYEINDNNNGLYLATLSIALSLYTNYFASMFAGIYLIVNAICYIRDKKFIKILFSGLISLILFLPCLSYCLRQVKYVSSNGYSNQIGTTHFVSLYQSFLMLIGNGGTVQPSIVINLLLFIVNFLLLIIEIRILISICKYSYNLRFRRITINLYISFFAGFILMSIFSLIKGEYLIQIRYGFPMFAIIYLFLLEYLINHRQHCNRLIITVLGILSLALLIINVKQTSYNSLRSFCNTDIKIVRQIHNHNFTESHHLYFNNSHNAAGTTTATFYSAYLPNYSPKYKIKVNSLIPIDALGSNNFKLMKRVYNNVIIKY